MKENNNNNFGLRTMKGVAVRMINGKIKQIRPFPDGIRYSLRSKLIHFVLCPEWGGGKEPLVVVCSINGEFLKPIGKEKMLIPFSFPYPYTNVFAGKELITVETHRDLEENYQIKKSEIINLMGSTYTVQTETIGNGSYADLAEKFKHFCPAIELAEKRKKNLKY